VLIVSNTKQQLNNKITKSQFVWIEVEEDKCGVTIFGDVGIVTFLEFCPICRAKHQKSVSETKFRA
jgi:hypothetical protein